jgi:hypothetical protein
MVEIAVASKRLLDSLVTPRMAAPKRDERTDAVEPPAGPPGTNAQRIIVRLSALSLRAE